MTRFQRGETMEGWNDCPVPMAASKPGSAAKSRKRLSSLYSASASTSAPAPAPTKTFKAPPMPPVKPPRNVALGGDDVGAPVAKVGEGEGKEKIGAEKVGENIVGKRKEVGCKTADAGEEGEGKNGNGVGGDGAEKDAAVSLQELREFCQSPQFSDADKAFFTKRLVEPYTSLSAPHQQFIASIIHGLRAREKTASLKAHILNYMMVHNGVSTWCVPLKKLVEVSS